MRKQKQKNNLDDRLLTAIYQDETGKVPNLNTIERSRVPRGVIAFVLSIMCLGFLATATWAGFSFIHTFEAETGSKLDVNIQGPERISLGQEMTYFVNWQNLSSAPIASADVHVSFPSEFTPTRIDPLSQQSESLRWNLKEIPVGARGTFTIRGIFTGDLDKQTTLQAIANYHSQKFGDHETVATLQILYADTVVQGEIISSPKVLSGDKVQVQYHIQNTGLVALTNIEMRLYAPKGFIADTSQLKQSEGFVYADIGTVEAGATSSIILSGVYASGSTGDMLWRAEFVTRTVNGVSQILHKTDSHMAVLGGDLSLKLVANGSSMDRSIRYGDLIRLTLGYENTSIEDLKDVNVRVRIDPIFTKSVSSTKLAVIRNGIDWKKSETTPNGVTSTASVFMWDKKVISALGRLAPQQDGTIDIALATLNELVPDIAGFQVTAEASMAGVGSTSIARTVRTEPIKFLFISDVFLSAETRYFSEEGVQLGSGPLPPIVGKSTTYHVLWTISKHIHELQDIHVNASLPRQVTWSTIATSTAGEILFDETSRIVSWTLNRMPEQVNEITAEFDIQLTPTEFDVGRFAQLIGEARFEAMDVDVKEILTIVKPGSGTDLPMDEGAKNKGVVRKQ